MNTKKITNYFLALDICGEKNFQLKLLGGPSALYSLLYHRTKQKINHFRNYFLFKFLKINFKITKA